MNTPIINLEVSDETVTISLRSAKKSTILSKITDGEVVAHEQAK